MPTTGPKERRERDVTDKSLRDERLKSDLEMESRNKAAVVVADAVVARARDDADEVLRTARDAEHHRPDANELRTRLTEDAAIQRNRDAADSKLEYDRGERTQALAALFAPHREVTDRHLQAERNRADLAVNSRDDFLGMVAHDLRGFMGEIAFRAASLNRGCGDDAEGTRVRKIGDRILRSTASMNRLVGDLLDIAAIEAGKLTVEIASADLATVLRDSAEGVRSAVEAKNISFSVQAGSTQVMAMFDHDRVVQVLGNLVSNAVKFTPSGGSITMRLETQDAAAKITVEDTGEGVPADKLETIFDRFTQVHPDRRGLGLGLYISRCLMAAQQGRIWATSTKGAGTQFHLTLPLST